jgi:hypothetical protein
MRLFAFHQHRPKRTSQMSDHRYACGQHVSFTDRRFTGSAWTGAFVIAELLPSGDGVPRYRIKSTGETYSRAALEHQLTVDAGSILRSRNNLPL